MLTVLNWKGTNFTHKKEASEEYFSNCKMVYVAPEKYLIEINPWLYHQIRLATQQKA